MKYVFLDMGDPWMEDEAVVIGPYDTEAEAVEAANGRVVTTLITPEEFLSGGLAAIDTELDEYWVVKQDGTEVSGPYKSYAGALREAEDREEEEGEKLNVVPNEFR